ncbi:uncharacterized protein N7498_010536 [Penicillium cinerascens]|uniref:Queuine tRNA-ribosyltransferase accessory subunit 2 n=1 Tax=Penicillium cinerascens TaxID=70096 RepID=A0A9W9JC13_9EURO|nr:uncharacterized protein N7498_010536 [Penicillium cinerascens]KAJ5191551.1 hypothetical protein N7498_010536 [Penicillium cinerascens]
MDPETSTPSEMTFSVLSSAAPVLAPRVGKLAIPGRQAISTPHFIPLTTRGAVSHIAHDVMRKETAINSLYIGLEDFIEKKHPAPLYKTPVAPGESPLRRFICAPDDMPMILAPRRFPAIPCPPTNTETSIAVLTSVGFRQLSAHQWVEAVQNLRPDIAIGLADIVTAQPPGIRRRGKMVDRTHAFTRDALEQLYGSSLAEDKKSKTAYFAPILPLENAQQSLYLEDLETEFRDRLSGLALYESTSLSFIPKDIGDLPRLLLSEPPTPHDILREISLGADLLTVPLIGTCSNAGIALAFTFPSPSNTEERGEPQPLGIDLWPSEYAKDTSPFLQGCECYACRHHHRAYLNHLLAAKEMTAWVLLQLHNHYIMDQFFAGVRDSIQRGTFEEDIHAFNRAYAPTLPNQTGAGPRLRGHYLAPRQGTDHPKRMQKVYGRLDGLSDKFNESQSSVATPDTDAEGLERHGFAEKV